MTAELTSEFSGALTPFWAAWLTLSFAHEVDVAVCFPQPSRTDSYRVANEAAAATLAPLVYTKVLTQVAAAPG